MDEESGVTDEGANEQETGRVNCQNETPCYTPVVVSETTFRSKPIINMTDNMVKVELTMSCNDWSVLKKALNRLADSHMKRLVSWFFQRRTTELWHPESPGEKVTVTRTWLGRLFKPTTFATLTETMKDGIEWRYMAAQYDTALIPVYDNTDGIDTCDQCETFPGSYVYCPVFNHIMKSEINFDETGENNKCELFTSA